MFENLSIHRSVRLVFRVKNYFDAFKKMKSNINVFLCLYIIHFV